MARDGRLHRVQRVIRQRYSGLLVGIRHEQSSIPVWLAASHYALAIPRPRSLGGQANWAATPISHLEYRKRLRRETTPPERTLWQLLRRKQLGVKFRRQHPIGPYIADFYSRDARLVVEVDGATHDGDVAQAYDRIRDEFLQSLGLGVLRIPAHELRRNPEGVYGLIQVTCQQQFDPAKAVWLKATEICKGDIVYSSPQLLPVRTTAIIHKHEEGEVHNMEIEGADSFLTPIGLVRSVAVM